MSSNTAFFVCKASRLHPVKNSSRIPCDEKHRKKGSFCYTKAIVIIMKLFPIRENHLYQKAYSKGKKFVGRYVVVYVLPDYLAKKLALQNPSKEKVNRVGITVTKKLGGAVVRNRAKRIIRVGFVSADKKKNIRRGNLIVIVARASIVGANSDDIEADFLRAFDKLFF